MHRIVSVKQVGWRIGVLRKKRLVLAEGRLRVRLCVLGLLAKHPSVGGEGRGSRSTSPLSPRPPLALMRPETHVATWRNCG